MKITDTQPYINKIRKVLKYPHIEYVRQKDTRLYFLALDEDDKQHDIWYNIKSDKYFETINGCAVLIKEILFFDTKESIIQYKEKQNSI